MQKKILTSGIIVIIIIAVCLTLQHYISKVYPVLLQYPLSDKTIIIDPGHGGKDPGKVAVYGKDEKALNLEVALKLKSLLKMMGATVVMTREDDDGLYLKDSDNMMWIKQGDMIKRRKIIQSSAGEMMVSIHMNSYPDTSIFGAQTFYLAGDPGSEKLGKLMQEELVAVSFKYNKRQAKENNSYFILKENNMPSVVVECGFLSNIEEEKMLNNADYQEKLAWALLKAITRYYYE
ncbi:MAG: N-acetylmuramoyl-L-alanine amidase [Eubacteriales bacterium]